jgi:DNA-binding NtrC family response regulator
MTIKILLVDDEIDFINTLSTRLLIRNYEVHTAFDGAKAMELFHNINFDVILLDILMPGLSGLEIYDQMKVIDPMVCVIMLTANTEIEMIMNSIQMGAFDYVIKPVIIEDLIEKIEMAFNHRKLRIETVRFAEEIQKK